MDSIQLPADVADKYSANVPVGCYEFPGFGKIDLAKLSVEQADQLTGRGFPHLVAKEAQSAPAPADQAKTKPAVKAAPAVPAADQDNQPAP